MLKGFVPPKDVPESVMHQYTGAYLAEHEFGVTDEDILNAIRYHTSGRAGMSELEKLICFSDMLEEGATTTAWSGCAGSFIKISTNAPNNRLKRSSNTLKRAAKRYIP